MSEISVENKTRNLDLFRHYGLHFITFLHPIQSIKGLFFLYVRHSSVQKTHQFRQF